ncbi:MAG: hypothetical protein PHS82_15270 [Lachnospiraceae bacterium]|nr:hypothetical protein [Lachnospiraceae bacterium]
MSDFLKFAYEIISKIVYNIAQLLYAFVKLFITGWIEYFQIFTTYFSTLNLLGKILSVLLMVVLVGIAVLLVVILIRRMVLRIRLKADKADNSELYREIGRLNKQVLSLIDEKNRILALKVNTMGGVEKIPYMGASALVHDTIPTVENVTDGEGNVVSAEGQHPASIAGSNGGVFETRIEEGSLTNAMVAASEAAAQAREKAANTMNEGQSRFPKLALVDQKYMKFEYPQLNTEISLQEFVEGYRLFAASQMKLYYSPEIIRRFVAGMAASKLLILEGISGTGKTSLPYSFSRYVCNPATIVSVQPSYRDRTELLGYFNEFSKRFNETEFLRALYEANYRQDPSFIVLDEMNLARIEYYFAEMLSVLEMPSQDEWILDLVPTQWEGDPEKIIDGKIQVPNTIWFVGTANNDDSTFTITDKVYDRAIPIELNDRAATFECEMQPACCISTEHLQEMFVKAKEEYPLSSDALEKMGKMDQYLQTRFKLAFGNRIVKQMYDFVPVYVSCGGTELGGMDYIIARKVLKKFESMNVNYVSDEIKGLIAYMEKIFGKTAMPDSKAYLERIQNLY